LFLTNNRWRHNNGSDIITWLPVCISQLPVSILLFIMHSYLHVGIFANFDFSPIFPLIFKFQKSLPLKSGGIFPCDLDISFTYQSSTLKPVTLGLTVLLYRYYVLVFFRHVEGSVPKDHYDWYPHCSTVVHLRLSQGGIQNATPTSTWDARKSQA